MSWLSLFLFLIMCGIMFFQSIHGMFSALIMAVICVLSATLALGAHEALAENVLTDLIGDYAYPVSFVGIFAVAVFALRVLLDKIIARNPLLPGFIDKAGSACLGIITGLVATGVMGIGIQMMPTGPTILGFRRLDEQGEPHHNLWLKPDAFTINLCGYLADYTLGGDAPWHGIHPDFLTELYWLRNTESAGSRISVGPESVKATGKLWTTERLYKFKRSASRGGSDSFEAVEGPPAGMTWLGVTVRIDQDAKDSDGRCRFSATQVRLVGQADDGMIEQYTPKGIGPYGDLHLTAGSLPLWTNDSDKLDFVFEVPEGFEPHLVEFKRSGRALLPPMPAGGVAGLESRTPTGVPDQIVSAAGSERQSNRGRRGSTTPVRPLKRDTHFGKAMPMTIRRYAGTSVDAGGGALGSGQLVLYVDRQEQPQGRRGARGNLDPEQTPLDSFELPQGLHMLQLNVEALHAKSILAGALNLTRRVLRQYRVIDKSGQHYWPAGLIAECDSGGDRVMEIQYFPEAAEIRSQVRSFQRIKHEDLVGDYRFVLLFILPEGTEIVKFDSGRKEVDISDLNLVAGG